MKRGFTLIELLIVVIILGILATIAIPQFGRITEKAKRAEADSNIAAIETAQAVYFLDHDAYATVADGSAAPGSATNPLDVQIRNRYWTTVSAGDATSYNITATRAAGGAQAGATYIKYSNGTVAGNYSYLPGM
jgi:type II secretion system protein G